MYQYFNRLSNLRLSLRRLSQLAVVAGEGNEA
jgi:hypothetical protein